MLRFFLLFLLIQGVLFTLDILEPVRQAFVLPFTELLARTSAWLVTLFDARVHAEGIILRNIQNGFAVSIEPGCNGIEASIVLIAAILAFPAPWKHKLIGLLAGLTAIQALNLVRIISLFYLGQWNMDVFEWAHLYLWQALIMLDALVVFVIWVRLIPATTRTPATAAP
ncbi:MAG: exosortase H [Hydrogenophilales bacterium]|nr:exosortase H [Hydrogenophilales bacterium]